MNNVEKNEIDKAYDEYVEQRKQERIKETQKRLKVWQTIRNTQKKQEERLKNHE